MNLKTGTPTRSIIGSFMILFGCAAFTLTARAQVVIPTVTIGNPGNAADSTGYGAVNYIYNIGTYDVTLNQYDEFLNSVAASDPYSLYNTMLGTDMHVAGISRSGSNGSYTYSVIGNGNNPVTYVNWFDAARFSNWLMNGQIGRASCRERV